MAGRFASRSDEEIRLIRTELNAKNTQKSNRRAAATLKAYLTEKKQPSDFENFDQVRLNEALSHFYMNLRKPDGEKYKVSSFENIRHSLNRYLQSPPNNKKYDIIKDEEFRDANFNYRAVMAELKRDGKGSVNHYPVILDADLNKLYNSVYLNTDTPTGLLNKVQMDIRLYFFRRGSENMHKMKKSTFCLKTDPNTGMKYVSKQMDELTKNHRETDKENSGGYMPELPGNAMCPVSSFQKYVGKLNVNCERFWQRPRDSFCNEDQEWYCNAPIGEKTLSAFMSVLSKDCKLSQMYTNHSIRATGATLLSRNQFGAAQIMSVTGHKSVSSLAVYQRVSDTEKLVMGHSIAMHVNQAAQHTLPAPSTMPALPAQSTMPSPSVPSTVPALPAPSATTAVPIVDVTEEDALALQPFVQDIMCEFSDLPETNQPSSRTMSQSNSLSANGMFSGCRIGSITININK